MSGQKPPGMPQMPGNTPKQSGPKTSGSPPPLPGSSKGEPTSPFNLFEMDEPVEPDAEGGSGGMGLFGSDLTIPSVPPKKKSPPSPPPAPPRANVNVIVKTALIGNILVQNGLLTQEQQRAVLQIQADPSNTLRFGEIAVSKGFVAIEHLNKALVAQQKYVKTVQKEQSLLVRLPEEVAKVKTELMSQKTSGESVGAKHLYKWLTSALKHGASDLHIMTGEPLILRHMSKMVKSKDKPLTKEVIQSALGSVLDASERESYKTNHSVVKCFDLPGGGRVRANIFKHMNGMNGTFRLIPEKIPFLVNLNLPSSLAKFTTYAQGLVLVTGPIGCGKTTTMASLLDIINQERKHHIITIESPCEFVHKSNRSLVTQRQVGTHTNTYGAALRAALREDPDVIAVGEMNDLETARLTISAAETGHLVFATLHTENAVRSINRLLDIFPPEEQNQVRGVISESLRGVISQILVKRNDAPGLIPVAEILFMTPAMRNLIREQKVYQLPNAIKVSKDLGNQLLEDHAREMLTDDKISKKTFEKILAGKG